MESPKRLRALAVANANSGVGKTAVAVNLAAAHATAGEDPVVAVDLDPQANLTEGLSVTGATGASLYRAVESGQPVEPVTTGRPGLSVVAAGERTAPLADLSCSSCSRAEFAGLYAQPKHHT